MQLAYYRENAVRIHELILKNVFNPLPDNKILDWSKLKQITDDNWKYI